MRLLLSVVMTFEKINNISCTISHNVCGWFIHMYMYTCVLCMYTCVLYMYTLVVCTYCLSLLSLLPLSPFSTVISAISPPTAPPHSFVAPPTSCSDSNRLPSPHSTTPPEQDPLDGNVNPLLLDMALHNNATTPSNEDHASSSDDPPTHHNEERRDTLGSLFQEENEGKKDGEAEDGCYGDDLAPLPGPWSFLYLRVSQSSQQSPANPIIGIEIPEPRNKRSSSPNVRSVRTWFIFAFPTPRYKGGREGEGEREGGREGEEMYIRIIESVCFLSLQIKGFV